MKLIKTGQSVMDHLQGRNRGASEYTATFDEAQSLTMEQAFDKFIDNLKNENKIVIDKVNTITYSVTSDFGHTYNMAYECIAKERVDYSKNKDSDVAVKKTSSKLPRKYTYSNDIWELKPSNILRYCCTRPYRFQNLFIDENETLVDITTHGVRDFNDRILYPQIDLRIASSRNPYILVETLYYLICKAYGTMGFDFKPVFEQDLSYLPGILLEDSCMLRKLAKDHTFDFFRRLCKHNELFSYFVYGCKLNINATFNGQDTKSMYSPNVKYIRKPMPRNMLDTLEDAFEGRLNPVHLPEVAPPIDVGGGIFQQMQMGGINNVVIDNPFVWARNGDIPVAGPVENDNIAWIADEEVQELDNNIIHRHANMANIEAFQTAEEERIEELRQHNLDILEQVRRDNNRIANALLPHNNE